MQMMHMIHLRPRQSKLHKSSLFGLYSMSLIGRSVLGLLLLRNPGNQLPMALAYTSPLLILAPRSFKKSIKP
jgi:hypothetical protein